MTINLTWQTIITVASVLGAIVAIWKYLSKVVRYMDKQKEQESEVQRLRDDHDRDVKAIREEQAIITFGLLACLKGLQQTGCNGPVTEAIDKLEKHLNIEAHK